MSITASDEIYFNIYSGFETYYNENEEYEILMIARGAMIYCLAKIEKKDKNYI